MREIKYRGWDKRNKLMFYDIQNGIDFCDGSHYKFHQFLEETDRWDVEQYTCLKDKNGTEIYEGGIWKCDTPSFKSTVVFYKGAFLQELIDNHANQEPDIWEDWEFGEVIGNIHQDKHLLDNP
jgi:hypothetical protein